MRAIAFLIAISGIAGLVALLAPLDEMSVLPTVLQHGDGATKLKFLVVTAAFGLAAVFGFMAIAKERMSRLHSVCTLVGFAAAAFVTEIWKFLQSLAEGMNQRSLSLLVLSIAIVLGLIASIAALVKSRATY
jgi:hypothetical protein